MLWSKVVQAAVLTAALCACAARSSADDTDGAAVAACRAVLEDLVPGERLATAVREQGRGFVVSAWRDGRPEGSPDYLCDVAREEGSDRGVAVVKVQTRDSSGGGYHSTLDLEFDEDQQSR